MVCQCVAASDANAKGFDMFDIDAVSLRLITTESLGQNTQEEVDKNRLEAIRSLTPGGPGPSPKVATCPWLFKVALDGKYDRQQLLLSAMHWPNSSRFAKERKFDPDWEKKLRAKVLS
jgi:hypothetical protein